MNDLFVDTSAWYPIADRSHPDHDALARTLRERIGQGARIVTTNLVVAESHALLLRRAGQRAALAFLKSVRQAPNRIEYITPGARERRESIAGSSASRTSPFRWPTPPASRS